jgi:hypothetical protein
LSPPDGNALWSQCPSVPFGGIQETKCPPNNSKDFTKQFKFLFAHQKTQKISNNSIKKCPPKKSLKDFSPQNIQQKEKIIPT